MRKRLLGALVCAFAISACSGPQPQAVNHVAGNDVALYVSPAVTGEENSIAVEIRGERVPDVSSIAISMPDMNMPAERLPVTQSGNGKYRAENIRFSMGGTWRVAVLERRGNGTRELTSFDIPVR